MTSNGMTNGGVIMKSRALLTVAFLSLPLLLVAPSYAADAEQHQIHMQHAVDHE